MKEIQRGHILSLKFFLTFIIVISFFVCILSQIGTYNSSIPNNVTLENHQNINNTIHDSSLNITQQDSTDSNIRSDAVEAEKIKGQTNKIEQQIPIPDKVSENQKWKNNTDDINQSKRHEEIERQYENYEDDKSSDYYNNIDNLDKKKKDKKKTKKEIQEEKYNEEWDRKVSKMHAHDLLTVKIYKRDLEVFYEEVEQVPLTITVAFYLHEEKSKIDFEIIDPKGKNIHKLKSKSRGFYEFQATEKGKYEFILSNEKYKRIVKATFALHSTKEDMKGLNADHLTNLYKDVDSINDGIREIHFNQKMLNRKFESHYDSTKKHNRNITFWSILETGLISIILISQLLYIKSLLDHN